MENLVIKKNANKIKRSGTERVLYVIVFAIFALYAFTLFAQVFWLVAWSLENKTLYALQSSDPFHLPKKLYFSNYVFAFSQLKASSPRFREVGFFGLVGNSVWYTALATVCPILVNACVSYVLAKYKFKLRSVYYGVIIFCMTIPIIGNSASKMQVYNQLYLLDTGPLLVGLAHATMGGMGFLVLYAFFRNISWSYAEAALIDGANHFTVFFRIMLPMALPAMGALLLVNGITAWNTYLEVLMFNPSWPGIASGLYIISRTLPRFNNEPAYYAALVISIIPVLVVFSIFQDKIMANFSVGGLKG